MNVVVILELLVLESPPYLKQRASPTMKKTNTEILKIIVFPYIYPEQRSQTNRIGKV